MKLLPVGEVLTHAAGVFGTVGLAFAHLLFPASGS